MAKRERGEGSVYLRGRIWWVKVYVNGKARPESSRSTKRSDAVRLLNRRRGEIASGRWAPDADRLTFENLAKLITDDYTLQGRRSMPRLQLALRHLREHFGDDRAVQITSDRLTAYANTRRQEDAALASVSKELAALRRAFNLAVRAGRLPSRPHFPTLELNNARQGFFEEVDFRAVRTELPIHLRPLMTCGFLSGWRTRDELRSMTWDRVDLKAGTMRLERSKNNEARVFPINADPELAELFRHQRDYTDEVQKRTGQIVPYVFHNEGRPIGDYYKAWRSACRRAGLPGRIPHDFRRSAARRLIQGGVPEQVAMRLIGWKSRAMLDRYFVVNERDLSEAVAKIANLRASEPVERRTVIPLQAKA